MGLFDRFRKQQVTLPLAAPGKEELHEFIELMSKNGLASAIEAQIQKSVDAASYYQAFEAMNDGGNYFGSEFNIRATASRIKSAYALEPWMAATASLIARTLSTVPFRVRNKATKEYDKNHPLNAKLVMGNRTNDGKSQDWCGALDLVLGGNYFKVFNESYTEAMHVPVERVQLEINQITRQVESLLIFDPGKEMSASTGTRVPYRQAIHLKYPNPYYPYYGMSLYTAASRPMLLDRYKNEFEMAFYLRGATNAGVIETTEDINKSRMDRLMLTFQQIYTGKRNWWRTIFLPKGAKWVDSGLTMNEMQHLESLKENRLTLLAVLGIPPSSVGIVQDVNRATSEVQERNLWNNTVKPLAEFWASGWNNSYLVKVVYGGLVEVVPDFSDIEALQGSLITKGEQAKSIEPYYWIDEIRKKVFNDEPLPNGAGQKFTAEVKGAGAGQFQLAAPQQPIAALPPAATTVTEPTHETTPAKDIKAQVVSSQERIERKLHTDYIAGYAKYLDEILEQAAIALGKGESVSVYLQAAKESRARTYVAAVEPTLQKAVERGFSFASSQSKWLHAHGKVKTKRLRFNETDQQAIDVLHERQANEQRSILAQRSITHFLGFDQTRSDEIVGIVEQGLADGKTTDQMAAEIRQLYGENYKNQAFTVARTELLTAISQGIKWNHDILGEVFTEVQKQWFHVGDIGSNPDARDLHVSFESEGPVSSGHKWGGMLEYPRDPSAPASETINCRCSMASVIPDSAESNAEVILENN